MSLVAAHDDTDEEAKRPQNAAADSEREPEFAGFRNSFVDNVGSGEAQ